MTIWKYIVKLCNIVEHHEYLRILNKELHLFEGLELSLYWHDWKVQLICFRNKFSKCQRLLLNMAFFQGLSFGPNGFHRSRRRGLVPEDVLTERNRHRLPWVDVRFRGVHTLRLGVQWWDAWWEGLDVNSCLCTTYSYLRVVCNMQRLCRPRQLRSYNRVLDRSQSLEINFDSVGSLLNANT